VNNLGIETIAVVIGFILRLGIPILITLLICWGLKRLDAHWQRQEANERFQQMPVSQHTCWNIRNCPPEKKNSCTVYQSGFQTPCWEQCSQDGLMQPACLKCVVWQLLHGQQAALQAGD